MYKIATLNKISPKGLKKLGDKYALTDDINSADGILVRSQDMLEMEFSPQLLAIARAGAGVNNIPLDRCAEKGIVVFNAPGANANAVKELVLTAMLAEARNLYDGMHWVHKLATKGDPGEIGLVKAVEKGKGQFAGREIAGKKICVIGLGAIGVLVANACEALGMEVVGYAPFMTVRAAHDMSNTVPFRTDLDSVIGDCDYVTVHVPASPQTNGMINADIIQSMKNGAILLNFSRDKLVDEDAVLKALDEGKLKKYITDFPNDKIVGHENIIYIPHLGASTGEAEDNCAILAVEEIKNYIENGNIENSVNFPACSLGKFISGNGKSRICILNKNVPGILGEITGMLAAMNINIANMVNQSKDNYAYTMVDTDALVDEASIIKQLAADDGIIRVRVIQ